MVLWSKKAGIECMILMTASSLLAECPTGPEKRLEEGSHEESLVTYVRDEAPDESIWQSKTHRERGDRRNGLV
ncbi:hypothetical protein JB92DRAFT_3064228 [Gautieria morchelliformis]|nr:hypothetical protein JB92DRAFT_3064228 [Gautieria morchelliformis]